MSHPEFDGNAAQVRLIAEQLLGIQEERQRGARSRFAASIPAWIACAFSLATLIWGAGALSSGLAAAHSQIEKNDQRITLLERDRQAIARIEGKVDILMEERIR